MLLIYEALEEKEKHLNISLWYFRSKALKRIFFYFKNRMKALLEEC